MKIYATNDLKAREMEPKLGQIRIRPRSKWEKYDQNFGRDHQWKRFHKVTANHQATSQAGSKITNFNVKKGIGEREKESMKC